MIDNLKNILGSGSIGTLIGVVGLAFAIVTWNISRRRKELFAIKRTYQIINKGVYTIQKLKILFDEKPVEDLTITNFTIWNKGNGTIEKDNIVTDYPLCIASKNSKESRILNAEIIEQSEPANKFSIETNPDKVVLDFDYVDKNDGVTIQIIHSGSSSDLYVDCKIKGGNLSQDIVKKTSSKGKKKRIGPNKILIGIEAALILLTTALYILIWIIDPKDALINAILLIYAVVVLPLFIIQIYVAYNLKVPKKLRKNVDIEASDYV